MEHSYGLGGPAAALVRATTIGVVISSLLVINRIWWRYHMISTLGIDDVLIVLALGFLLALGAITLLAVDYGYGRRQNELPPTNAVKAGQMFLLYQIFYKLSLSTTKLSILTLYLRIFPKKWFKQTCLLLATVITLYTTASILVTIFQCHPVSRAFDKSTPGTCINLLAFWYANATHNLATDAIILLAVPMVVWNLELPQRQKIGLCLVLCLGVFTFITSVLRVTTLKPGDSIDATRGTYRSTLWSTIEASMAVTCACLPMIRTLIKRVFPKLFPSFMSRPRSRPRSRSAGGGGIVENDGALRIRIERWRRRSTRRDRSDRAAAAAAAAAAATSNHTTNHGNNICDNDNDNDDNDDRRERRISNPTQVLVLRDEYEDTLMVSTPTTATSTTPFADC